MLTLRFWVLGWHDYHHQYSHSQARVTTNFRVFPSPIVTTYHTGYIIILLKLAQVRVTSVLKTQVRSKFNLCQCWKSQVRSKLGLEIIEILSLNSRWSRDRSIQTPMSVYSQEFSGSVYCLSILSLHPSRPHERQWGPLCHSPVKTSVAWCLSILSPTQNGPLRPNEDLCVTLPSRIQWFGIYPSSPPPNKAPLGTVRISVSLYSQEFLGVVSIHSLPPTIKAPWSPLRTSVSLFSWGFSGLVSIHSLPPPNLAPWGPL